MEKNKNRTGMLAAGRKKLEQYRQKKEGKGGSSSGSGRGKSSDKSSKSGHSTGAVLLPIVDAEPADESAASNLVERGMVEVTDADVVSVGAPVNFKGMTAADSAAGASEGDQETGVASAIDSSVGDVTMRTSADSMPVDSSPVLAAEKMDERGTDLGSNDSSVPLVTSNIAERDDALVMTGSLATLLSEVDKGNADSAIIDSSFSPVMVKGHEGDAGSAFVDSSVSPDMVEVEYSGAEPVCGDSSVPLISSKVAGDTELATDDLSATLVAAMIDEGDADPVPHESSFSSAIVKEDEKDTNPGHVDSSLLPVMVKVEEGDTQLVPLDSWSLLVTEETGEAGIALLEMDQTGDAKLDRVAADQEAECLGLVQSEGSSKRSHGSLQDAVESLEVGLPMVGTKRDENHVVSDAVVGDGMSKAPEADDFSISAKGSQDEESNTAVSVREDTAESKIEDVMGYCYNEENDAMASSYQDFVSEKKVIIGGVYNEHHHFPEDAVSTCIELPEAEKVKMGKKRSSISIFELAKVPQNLGEEEIQVLHKLRELALNMDAVDMANRSLLEGHIDNGLESLKQQLFLTHVEKDCLSLQLTEQIKAQMEFDQQERQLIDEVSKLRALLVEFQKSNTSTSEELVQCRSQLQNISAVKEEYEIQCLSARGDVDELKERASGLQHKLVQSQEESMQLSAELANCKDLVGALQLENATLTENLSSVANERKKLEMDKEHFASENLKLAAELSENKERAAGLHHKLVQLKEEATHISTELANCKDLVGALQLENATLTDNLSSVADERKKLEMDKEYFAGENLKLAAVLSEKKKHLVAMHDQNMQLEADFKEAMSCFERLTEENIYLSSILDVHEEKVREIDGRYQLLLAQSREAGNQVGSLISSVVSTEKANEDSQITLQKCDGDVICSIAEESGMFGHAQAMFLPQIEMEGFSDSAELLVLKGHIEETEKIVYKLERLIQAMYSQSASMNRSGGKMSATGVSKLIQAFELKVHQDDTVSNDVPSSGGEHSADPFKLAQEQTSSLRAVLEQFSLNVEKGNKLFKEGQDSKRLATVALKELEIRYETQKQLISNLEGKNGELIEKVAKYQSRFDEILNQFNEIKRTADETSGILLNQVESLQKEVSDKTASLEQERISLTGAVTEAVEKLDSCIGKVVSTSLISSQEPDVGGHMTSSVNAAIATFEDLNKKLEAAYLEHERIWNAHRELNQSFTDMQERNDRAFSIVNTVYSDLMKLANGSSGNLENSEMNIEAVELLNLVHSNCERLIEKLQKSLDERHELQHAKNELESELMNKAHVIEVLEERCVDLGRRVKEVEINSHPEIISQLVENIVTVLHPNAIMIDSEMPPVRCLEASVVLLLQKYREAVEQVSLSKDYLREFVSHREHSAEDWVVPLHTLLKEEIGLKITELCELKEKVHQLNSLNLSQDDDVRVLEENLNKIEEALEVTRSELHAKETELEQSEQRLSSVREKLAIAVAKGKGLVVQRDSLKQSLAEKSSELEKCLQELQMKDAALHEVELKLKAYSEAGERVEALETELSYIRNSATALRESFLLKDSILQRIEEILEDLELPEHFHSRDTIEKIEWLARSVTGNSLPLTDWDRKSDVGGSYSDGGFVVMDAWKEDSKPSSNQGFDDLRQKYDELQSRFYGLAEHNEMLEQSLVERNNLVQRWEEVLDRIEMPPQLRSMEPEDKIEWLGKALSEAQCIRDAFQVKIENLEVSSDSLAAELEMSQKNLSEVKAELMAVTHEKELLSESMERLTCEHQKISEKAAQDESVKENLLEEIADLQEKLDEKIENYRYVEDDIQRLQGLVNKTLLDHDPTVTILSGSSLECLEGLLRKLIDNYVALCSEKSLSNDAGKKHVAEVADRELAEKRLKDALEAKEQELLVLKEELDAALGNLVLVKEERDATLQKCQSLLSERETICKQRDDLQEQLRQEEQKAASAREKLNVAVRKGKGLVQQRDGLKQTIDEMHVEVQRLKVELTQREDVLLRYEQKIQDFSSYSGKVEVLESENSLLRNQLAETEKSLQDSSQTLSGLLTSLHAIDVGEQVISSDPAKKMEVVRKLCYDLHTAAVSSEQEANKSKRSAELLLAELNEVQERAENLQEELAKAEAAAIGLSEQRDKVEAARAQALLNLQQFIAAHEKERINQHANLVELKAGVDQLQEECYIVVDLVANVFSKDLELFQNVEAGVESFLKQMNSINAVNLPLLDASQNVTAVIPMDEGKISAFGSFSEQKMQDGNANTELIGVIGANLQGCLRMIDGLKRNCHTQFATLKKQATNLPELMQTVRREISFQNDIVESLKKDVTRLESLKKEKDAEINMVNKNIALLYEACRNSLSEIENRKAQIIGNGLDTGFHSSGKIRMTLPMHIDRKGPADGWTLPFTVESIRTMADTLLSAVKGSANIQAELEERSQKELRATISHLQKELQEKDIQSNRICSELVTQIKEAEATAKNYMADLEAAKTQVHSLEKQIELMKNEQRSLEIRVTELSDCAASSKQLQETVRSLTDVVTAKDQEIESLMQALDEEESQMEDLSSKIEELEKIVQQKNLALESLESSRGKAMAKLSMTVSKFDELHHLSENLLSEIENLQTQLQGRDAEISFLRQEVTRCTSDVLTSQENIKRNSTEVQDLLTRLSMMASRFGVHDVPLDDRKGSQINAYMEVLQNHITTILTELDDQRALAQSKDALLQIEKSKVEELLQKREILEISLHEKESQLALSQGAIDSAQPSNANTLEPLEIEPMINKRAGTIAPHVRSVRKVNNDQVAINMEASNSTLDDDDDDKVHGFKSLAMSRIVPKFTRPVADRIDGIWVSGERMLMRQPTLRLGVVIYWFVLHILLATSIV